MKNFILKSMTLLFLLFMIQGCEKEIIKEQNSIESESNPSLTVELRAGSIEVTPLTHDFGDVLLGDQVSTIVSITNTGDDILVIDTDRLTNNSTEFIIITSVWPPIELWPLEWGVPEESTFTFT